jgi:hypothetical protein
MYPPSFDDVYTHTILKRALRDHYGLSLTSRVIDGSGVWEYDTSDQEEQALRLPDYSGENPRWIQYPEVRPYLSPFMLAVQRRSAIMEDFQENLEPITADTTLPVGAMIASYIRTIARRGFTVTFTPRH